MSNLLIVDIGPDGRASVSGWPEGEQLPSAVGEPFPLRWPLDRESLEDLRWYLEDYLLAPYGVYEDRGPEVARALPGWGAAVFESLFGSGPARDAYLRARASGGAGTEVVFRSPSATVLGLPWELLHDPARPTPMALDSVELTRSIPTAALGEAFAVSGDRLRVLMVISRPAGGEDVGYRMIARPLLEQLETVRGKVELVVLRPPTLEALRRALADARAEGQPFQVVHFDGHGVLAGRSGLPVGLAGLVTLEQSGEGVLVFEKPEGGPDHVSADEVAQVLKQGEVPLAVLNACQSGAVGKTLEAAVATRLLQEGVGSVVAMAYTVYAVAAAEFMAAFYECLFAGKTVTVAVGAGRRHLSLHDQRPSPKGEMPLEDWLVPVHYMRTEVHFPELQRVPTGQRQDRQAPDASLTGSEAGADALVPVGSFVGRDALFYELEVAARLQRVVILHGSGGGGKTELAKAFGRWWRDTGGVERPEWVIFHSFEPGVASFGLDGVISGIGLAVFGPDFSLLERKKRVAEVERALREHRLLLIWDNFETVFTMPDPTAATPALDEAGREELRKFLQRIAADGRSAVVVTSRSTESWLGEMRRIAVGGLVAHEASEYADEILAPYPSARPERAKPAFAELLEWLQGHPLSMRLVLPHLATSEPKKLLEALRGSGELPSIAGELDGRTSSLNASVNYSLRHLSPGARRLLVAISLFQGVADVDVLAMFSKVQDVPERFAAHSRETWDSALNEAAEVGLLTRLPLGMYQIHPALPSHLAAHWRSEEPDAYEQQRDVATQAMLLAYAALGEWLGHAINGEHGGAAVARIDCQCRTLGYMLGYALDHRMWRQAQAIAPPLDDYFDRRGRTEEARAWCDRARVVLEGPGGTPPDVNSPAGSLWLFYSGSEANRQVRDLELQGAESTYREILEMLTMQPKTEKPDRRLAVSYHQLGVVAQMRGQLDDAERRYFEALAVEDELSDSYAMARTYHQLGWISEERDQLDDAERWYVKALKIKEEHGDRSGMASTYHHLGGLAEKRGQLDDAERAYGKALEIMEEFGDRSGMAQCYHQIGLIAQRRGQFDDAERLYLKTLEIMEELNNKPKTGLTYGQLGLLAEERGQDSTALLWLVRSMSVFDEFPHPQAGPGPKHLARLTIKLGTHALEAAWKEITGLELPDAVRTYVEAFREGPP